MLTCRLTVMGLVWLFACVAAAQPWPSTPAWPNAAAPPDVAVPAYGNAPPPPVIPMPTWATTPSARSAIAAPESLTESTWYTRIDYFHWNERLDGEDFVNEDGPLITLGYQRRIGPERFRGELFGGSVGYNGGVDYEDGTSEPLKSHTNYLGVRAEYDLLYEPDWSPAASFFVGVGSRFWFRDLPDDYTASGNLVWGYQETWWTIYPYLGVETRRTLDDGFEFYISSRIGATVITYEHVTWDDVTLYPKPGLTGQLDLGVRGRHLSLSGFFEGMAWGESPIQRGSLQPASRMLTAGLRGSLSF
jgi:hypothetical protein